MQLHLFGQIQGCMGIPNHTRDLFREICNQNPSTIIHPLVLPITDQYDLDEGFMVHIDNKSITNQLTGSIFIFWTPDLYQQIINFCNRDKCLIVAYPIWEWTKLNKQWIDGIKLLDYVACASSWHRQVLLDNGIPENKIIILTAGINESYKQNRWLQNDNIERKFLFVGKNEKRKCISELLLSFAEAFPNKEAELTLLVSDPHDRTFNVQHEYRAILDKINVDVSRHPKSTHEMSQLYAEHRYILVPSRAGGIELPLIEAMAMGCLPIVTRASGMQHYLPQDYKWFIPVKCNIPMYDNRWFPATTDWGVWAEPDWKAFIQLLKKANTYDQEMFEDESTMLSARTQYEYNYIDICKAYLRWADLAMKAKQEGLTCK